jgi:hypothetical protein
MTEKRTPRSYKARQTPYVLASEKAKGMNTTLAEVVETVIVFMAAGHRIEFRNDAKFEKRQLKTAVWDKSAVESNLKVPKSKPKTTKK